MRVPRSGLALWLAGIYLAWSLLVYFGSLGSDGHAWWPVFLYPIIWPASALYEWATEAFLDWQFSGSRQLSDSFYLMLDGIAGAYYIVIGSLWVYFLVRLIQGAVKKRRAETPDVG
jgi:hypothetical protein